MATALKHYAADGATQITGKNWPEAKAGEAQTAEKFAVENVSDRALDDLQMRIAQVGANDGYNQMRCAPDTVTLSKPYGVAAALSAAGAGGVWGSTGLKYYRVTALNANGETIGSDELSVNVDVTTKKVTLTWTELVGASGYKVYRSDASGSYGASSLRATVSGQATTTYVDDGGSLSSGTLPAANTTGGAAPAYGAPSALGVGPLVIGDVPIGKQVFYWMNRIIPGGTSEGGNPRRSIREFVEP
jgi:hypothetical protein